MKKAPLSGNPGLRSLPDSRKPSLKQRLNRRAVNPWFCTPAVGLEREKASASPETGPSIVPSPKGAVRSGPAAVMPPL